MITTPSVADMVAFLCSGPPGASVRFSFPFVLPFSLHEFLFFNDVDAVLFWPCRFGLACTPTSCCVKYKILLSYRIKSFGDCLIITACSWVCAEAYLCYCILAIYPQRLEKQHSKPVFARNQSAPKNRKIDNPDVPQRTTLKYHAMRTVEVVYRCQSRPKLDYQSLEPTYRQTQLLQAIIIDAQSQQPVTKRPK